MVFPRVLVKFFASQSQRREGERSGMEKRRWVEEGRIGLDWTYEFVDCGCADGVDEVDY